MENKSFSIVATESVGHCNGPIKAISMQKSIELYQFVFKLFKMGKQSSKYKIFIR